MPAKSATKATRQYKLLHDLVPANLSGLSAYRLLKNRAVWRKRIRLDTLAKCRFCCVACGTNERPECNEIWVYFEAERIAQLSGFEILCADCHWAAHIGLAKVRGVYAEALSQFCRVNGLARTDAETIVVELIRVRNKRGKIPWKVVVASHLLEAYPELKILERDLSVNTSE